MNKNEITIMDGIPEFGIIEKDNSAWTTSNKLSEYFDKRHDHVMESIADIEKNLAPDFWGANFKKSTYENRGKKYKNYFMTKKGFVLVAMGFTGEKAMNFKVEFIEAFEAMSSFINTRLLSKDGYKEMSSAIKQYLNPTTKTYMEEADMINNIILGMSAKNFREINNITDGNTRDGVTDKVLTDLDKAQRLNSQLIKAELGIDARRAVIKRAFAK